MNFKFKSVHIDVQYWWWRMFSEARLLDRLEANFIYNINRTGKQNYIYEHGLPDLLTFVWKRIIWLSTPYIKVIQFYACSVRLTLSFCISWISHWPFRRGRSFFLKLSDGQVDSLQFNSQYAIHLNLTFGLINWTTWFTSLQPKSYKEEKKNTCNTDNNNNNNNWRKFCTFFLLEYILTLHR